MKEYKVIAVKERSFLKGRLTPEQLEKLLNEYARDGWSLKTITSAETVGLMSAEGFFVTFERDAP